MIQDVENGVFHNFQGRVVSIFQDYKVDEPFNADDVRVFLKSISIMQLRYMIDEGAINITPDFQRYYVWKETDRKALLIESLMLNYPLPLFYVSENPNGVWDVVDGLQRISTINDFINNRFRLQGVQYLLSHNGSYFQDLPLKYKQRILNTMLTFTIIDSRTPVQAKYDIFRRVNTGGVPLNAQEIRNSVAAPHVRSFLNKLAGKQIFRDVIRLRNDMRMQSQELVLRFCAFLDGYNPSTGELQNYRGLEPYLDFCFDRMNHMNDVEFNRYEYHFVNALEIADTIFGKFAFRKVYPADLLGYSGKNRPLNKALFTAVSVVLANHDAKVLQGVKEKIALDLAKMIAENSAFADSISRSTASNTNVRLQFYAIHRLMEGYK